MCCSWIKNLFLSIIYTYYQSLSLTLWSGWRSLIIIGNRYINFLFPHYVFQFINLLILALMFIMTIPLTIGTSFLLLFVRIVPLLVIFGRIFSLLWRRLLSGRRFMWERFLFWGGLLCVILWLSLPLLCFLLDFLPLELPSLDTKALVVSINNAKE